MTKRGHLSPTSNHFLMVSRFSKPKSTYVCCFDMLRNICIREKVDCHKNHQLKRPFQQSLPQGWFIIVIFPPFSTHIYIYIYIIYIYIYSHEYSHEYSHLKLHLFGVRRPRWQNTPPAPCEPGFPRSSCRSALYKTHLGSYQHPKMMDIYKSGHMKYIY